MLELNKVYCADCLEGMKQLEDNSVDAVVTDPPYGLSFMGKKWDYDVPKVEIWKECLRVLKPGGFLLSFAGSRTYHKICSGIEDAGFEIRDQIMWIYGSGFPKSLNIEKAIDKLQGVEHPKNTIVSENRAMPGANYTRDKMDVQSEKAKEWDGWGTALKPAHEPIVVARKPLGEKTVALNVLKWGTGGINIDECRIGNDEMNNRPAGNKVGGNSLNMSKVGMPQDIKGTVNNGRFPANIIFDEEAGKMLDEQSGVSNSKKSVMGAGISGGVALGVGGKNAFSFESERGHNDSGGASRFFYCAKSSKSERNKGCDELDERQQDESRKVGNPGEDNPRNRGVHQRKNFHPTIKPISLMQYLVKLVTPKGGVVLDPFIGSGTTGIACYEECFNFIGFEKSEEYYDICLARIGDYMKQKKLNVWFG